MNVYEVRRHCLALPEAKEKLQWGDALCFKVREKIFAVLGLDQVRLIFKCAPATFAELIELQDIRPSPYLGRHNWVMLDRLDVLRDEALLDLIRQSYEMVAAKAPGGPNSRNNRSKRKAAKNKSAGSRARNRKR